MDLQECLAQSIGRAEAKALWPHLTVERHPPGVTLIRDGVPGNHLYFLAAGSLTVAIGTEGGPVSLGVVEPGSWLGEIGFVDRGPATATVTTGEGSLLLRISHDELIALKDEDPHAAAVLLRTVTRQLAARLRRSTAGIVEQVAEGRYRLKEPTQQQTWLQQTLGWLLGTGGTA